MKTGNAPLHQLLQELIAEERLNPVLAQKLLEEILRMIEKHHIK